MDHELETLRTQIDVLPKTAGGRRYYTSPIRSQVVDLAKRWQELGKPLHILSDTLGIHVTTVAGWLRGAKRVREVKISSGPEAEPRKPTGRPTPASTLVVVFPSGVRIEGLDPQTLAEIVGALR